MVGVREHVYRLNGLHFIFRIEQLQVARLRSRITADVYDAFGFGKQNDITITSLSRYPEVITMQEVMMTSGRPYWLMKSCVSMSFISPAKNNVFLIPLISALTLASSMASGTYSMPITWRACLDTKLAMVPVPV